MELYIKLTSRLQHINYSVEPNHINILRVKFIYLYVASLQSRGRLYQMEICISSWIVIIVNKMLHSLFFPSHDSCIT